MSADLAAVAALRVDPAMAPLHRSLAYYYGDRERERAMDALYAQFLGPGQLGLDIGAHVGDRIASFRRLGARVVALEPQPLCARALAAIYARDDHVTVRAAACGAARGTVTLHVNSANPTVSTVSAAFVRAAEGAAGWEEQAWDSQLDAPVTTLDELVAAHGPPAFTKIDVEGFEDQVLAGLSQPLPALSFEFTTIAREVAYRCLDRLAALGPYRFNLALGESHRLVFDRWQPPDELAGYLAGLPHAANAGDVYCVGSS